MKSEKSCDTLAQGIEARRAETSGSACESPVANGDAPVPCSAYPGRWVGSELVTIIQPNVTSDARLLHALWIGSPEGKELVHPV
jgi:hypothetical protein